MEGSIVNCPVCNREFNKNVIEEHVNKCLFLNQEQDMNSKRSGSHLPSSSTKEKRIKLATLPITSKEVKENQETLKSKNSNINVHKNIPLAEQMRPIHIDDIVGQNDSFGTGSMLRCMLEQKKIPNLILWGPPGCGKTSLANVISNICKVNNDKFRFVKLSGVMSGINDVKEVIKVAKNEAQFKRQTVLFMDEIHRFNKLQQDTFLPHVENGTIILIGATTENPSFSLNNALLSRCRVVVMQKLSVEEVLIILEKVLKRDEQVVVIDKDKKTDIDNSEKLPKYIIERGSLQWLAEICDGDARVALGALEMALAANDPGDLSVNGPGTITLEHLKNGIKRSHLLYDRRGEEHYNVISALHKSVRAGDENAALYWVSRAMRGGEDPLYIARRLIRIASEDIGLADPSALVEAVACLQGCQQVGMPECDVVLAACAVRLARAPKSRALHDALRRCQRALDEAAGPLPPVPLHLRNAPTKLMQQLGYGKGYNLMNKNESGLSYMPDDMENVDFFSDLGNG